MAKKAKKIEDTGPSFEDLMLAAGVTFEEFSSPVDKNLTVDRALAKYRGTIRVLHTEEGVNYYFDQILKNGIVALDTETNNSLDVHNNVMVGLCLYTPFNRPVYIPIGHRNRATNELSQGQVSKAFLHSKIAFLLDQKIKIVYHNAKFDINVVRHNFGIILPCYWDNLIGIKVLDENRRGNGLKALYSEVIDPAIKEYHVNTFFDNNVYADLDDFGLYSAIDSYETYQIYLWQRKVLSTPSMEKLLKLLLDLEFRVTEVCADLEWRGFEFNSELCCRYRDSETVKLNALGELINKKLEPYADKIRAWPPSPKGRGMVPELDPETNQPVKKKVRKVITNKFGRSFSKLEETDEIKMIPDPYASKKIEWPVKLTSPDQILVLFNCILDIPLTQTTVDGLKEFGGELGGLIGKYRHIHHNLTSFFNAYLLLNKGGRIYGKFNQMGDDDDTVVTGRFSAKDPNLMQLPARQQEDGVRLCFGGTREVEVEKEIPEDLILKLHFTDQVNLTDGSWVKPADLRPDMVLDTDEGPIKVLETQDLNNEWWELKFEKVNK